MPSVREGVSPRRIVAQFLVMKVEVGGIETKALNATFQPELRHFEDLSLNFLIVEIEVRLAGKEIVHVILAAAGIPLPRRAPKDREPIIRWRPVGLRLGPDEPIRLWIVPAGAALFEPGMLIGGMTEYLIDHHFQSQFIRALHHSFEIFNRAEHRIDARNSPKRRSRNLSSVT